MGGVQGSDSTEPQILAEPQMLGASMEWGVVTTLLVNNTCPLN